MGVPYLIGQMRGYLRIVLLLTLIHSAQHAAAVRVHLFDIDGTLVHDTGLTENGKRPAWWTYWILDRVSSVNNGWNVEQARRLIELGSLPERIYLNKNEVDRWMDRFASRNERIGNVEPVELDSDPIRESSRPEIKPFRPKVIYPGYYRIEESFSYALHRDSERSPSPLIDSFLKAVARSKRDPAHYDWQGRAFPFFVKALKRQSLDERIYFLTDRDHTQASYLDWVAMMHKMGYIPKPTAQVFRTDGDGVRSPDVIFPKNISASSLDARLFGSVSSFDSRKSLAILDRAMNLSRSPLAKQMVIGSDYNDALSGSKRSMHELIIYENRPQYIRELIKAVKQHAAYFPNIKFVFFHAGELDSVEALLPYSPQPIEDDLRRWFVLTPSGTGLRHLTKAEFADFQTSECQELLSTEN